VLEMGTAAQLIRLTLGTPGSIGIVTDVSGSGSVSVSADPAGSNGVKTLSGALGSEAAKLAMMKAAVMEIRGEGDSTKLLKLKSGAMTTSYAPAAPGRRVK
jgi:hypothetical protein